MCVIMCLSICACVRMCLCSCVSFYACECVCVACVYVCVGPQLRRLTVVKRLEIMTGNSREYIMSHNQNQTLNGSLCKSVYRKIEKCERVLFYGRWGDGLEGDGGRGIEEENYQEKKGIANDTTH